MLEACDQVEAFARCLLSGVFDVENTPVRWRRDKINDSDVLKRVPVSGIITLVGAFTRLEGVYMLVKIVIDFISMSYL